jgi:hypothetical protein
VSPSLEIEIAISLHRFFYFVSPRIGIFFEGNSFLTIKPLIYADEVFNLQYPLRFVNRVVSALRLRCQVGGLVLCCFGYL